MGPWQKQRGHERPWMSENQAIGEWNKTLVEEKCFLSLSSASCGLQQCVRTRITVD